MKKILLGIAMAFLCVLVLSFTAGTYTLEVPFEGNIDEIRFEIDGEGSAEITDLTVNDGVLKVQLESRKQGKFFLMLTQGEETLYLNRFFVLPGGIITQGNYFGDCRGDVIIPLFSCVYLMILIISIYRRYRQSESESIYRYQNVRLLGLLIFLSGLLVQQIFLIPRYEGFHTTITSAINSASSFSISAFPFVFLMSLYLIWSNFTLIRKEGRTWRNMLGMILGALLCFLTLAPNFLSDYLQNVTYVDVHNENGAAHYIEEGLEGLISGAAAYLECILAGTIVYALKAARHIPSFDRDYILILGCQIKEDGTLTKLLQSRADRAIEFAAMQKEKTGRDIIYVPSGGKGSDEVRAEADAIMDYLIATGISADHILSENRSANTYENFRNSLQLIRSHTDKDDPKIAFSTTNYHVFRSGVIAESMGVHAEGIGAPTRIYFWINAFIREFIATLSSDRKSHIKAVAVIMVLMVILVSAMYFSVNM